VLSADRKNVTSGKAALGPLSKPVDLHDMRQRHPMRPVDLQSGAGWAKLSDRLAEGMEDQGFAPGRPHPKIMQLGRQGHKVAPDDARDALPELGDGPAPEQGQVRGRQG
jgi:hypothetical protein